MDGDSNSHADPDEYFDGDLYGHSDFDAYSSRSDELGEDGSSDESEGGGCGSIRFDVACVRERGRLRNVDRCFADGATSLDGVVRVGTRGDGERQYDYVVAGVGFDGGCDGVVHGAGGSGSGSEQPIA